jgi:hypothetical protein
MTVSVVTTALSAGAASVAAVLSAINLRYSACRDRLTWVRSALENAFVDFLTASYSAREACREIATLRQGRGSRMDEAEWRSIAETAHDTMMKCATRSRVLAQARQQKAHSPYMSTTTRTWSCLA